MAQDAASAGKAAAEGVRGFVGGYARVAGEAANTFKRSDYEIAGPVVRAGEMNSPHVHVDTPGDKATAMPNGHARSDMSLSPGDNTVTSNQEIAAALVARHGITVEGFDATVDPRVARDMVQAVDDMLIKYPQIDLRRISITDMGDSPSFAESRPNMDPNGKVYTEFIINRSHITDWDEINETYREAVRIGYHPAAPERSGMYAKIIHEIGHAMEDAGGMLRGDTAKAALRQAWRESHPLEADNDPAGTQYGSWLRQLSDYSFMGNTQKVLNVSEALPEAFAEVELNPNAASDPARVLHKLLVDRSLMQR